MRAVVQRVRRARVTVEETEVGAIGPGLLVLLGVAQGDDTAAADWMAAKIAQLRVFPDEAGRMQRSLEDLGGGVLVVSQFTLLGDARKGNRPSFIGAAEPAVAEPLYEAVMTRLRERGLTVAGGRFGAMMQVELVNDGPVTIILER